MALSEPVLLFLHIPKTGGSTLKACFDQVLYAPEIQRAVEGYARPVKNLQKFYKAGVYYYPIGFYMDPDSCDAIYYGDQLKDSALRAVIGHFSYGIHAHIQQAYHYVTFLREPVDRVISLYFHLKSEGIIHARVSLNGFVEDMQVEDWVANLKLWYPQEPEFSEAEIRKASRLIACNDQTRRVAGCHANEKISEKEMLARAKENLKSRFAFVGLNERFDESLLLLSQVLSWRAVPNYLPRLINTQKKASSKPDEGTLNLVRKKNMLDIELYEYGLRIFEEALNKQSAEFGSLLNEYRRQNDAYKADRLVDIDSMSLH